jgi:hypothetical protein
MGDVHIESTLTGWFKRYYEGSKPLFALQLLGVGYVVAVLLFGDLRMVALALGVGLMLTAGIRLWNRSQGVTYDDRIPVESISLVKAKQGSRWKGPRFVVQYETDEGRRRRYVTLPAPWLPYTAAEFERGKQAFEERDITVVEM